MSFIKKCFNYVKKTYAYDDVSDANNGKSEKDTGSAKRTPETPYGLKIAAIDRNGIDFYWKKLEIADGYEVYRSYSKNGSFENIYTAERRNIGDYYDSDFDHSKTKVFYKVRSYITDEDGSKILSEEVDPVCAEFVQTMMLERPLTCVYSGQSRSIKAIYGWGEPTDTVWTSDDESVATVKDGVICGIAAGKCTISCTSAAAGQTAEGLVIVDRTADEPLNEVEPRYIYNKADGVWENPNAEKTDEAVILMVGDIMCGKRQMKEQADEKLGWDFSGSFEFVKDITAKSDFAVANLETLMAPGWPYMTDETFIDNKNNCNAPPRILDGLRYGGFDAITMSNNHNCDGGVRALNETIEQVEKYGYIYTGVFKNEAEKRFFIADVNGIKVGFVAYMSKYTGFNGKDKTFSSSEKSTMLNVFSEKTAKSDIQACRDAGAEFVVAYMHWGQKNYRNVTDAQINEANAAANAGADYIVGSNPHLVQRYDELTTDDGRTVPCFYSVGNFISVMNQVQGNRDSVYVRIKLARSENGKVVLAENSYIPAHTYKDISGLRWATVAVNNSCNENASKLNHKKYCKYIINTIGDGIAPIE